MEHAAEIASCTKVNGAGADLRPRASLVARRVLEGLAATEDVLADGFEPGAPDQRRASLTSGSAGLAVALAEGGERLGDESLRAAAERYLDHALGAAAEISMDASLAEGVAGLGWAAARLGRGRQAAIDLAEVDRFLLDVLGGGGCASCELLYGAVGIGVYALTRLGVPAGRTLLEAVIETIASRAHHESAGGCDGAHWPEGEHRRTDLGMAHGTAGVIAFLARCYAASVTRDRIGPLLCAAMSWLRSCDSGGEVSRYPAFHTPNAGRSEPGWDGWCYGDLGIAAAFLAAGSALGRADWTDAGLALARGVARSARDRIQVVDASLCHGTAGLARFFQRAGSVQRDRELGAAADLWLARTLDLYAADKPCGGYAPAHLAEGRLRSARDPGLLVGPAGVALTLLDAAAGVTHNWDACLLLDF